MHRKTHIALILVVLALVASTATATAWQGEAPNAPRAVLDTSFTYQGYLTDDTGNPVTDTCDFRFRLYNTLTAGTQIGTDIEEIGIEVENGYFNTRINKYNEFGNTAFDGSERYLAIAAKCTYDTSYLSLGIRQRLSAAPYALSARSVHSSEDITFYLSPQNMKVRNDSTSTAVRAVDGGSAYISLPSDTVTKHILLPMNIYGELFGGTMYVKSIEVCYYADNNGSDNYIGVTRVYKNGGGSTTSEVILLDDNTNHTSDTYSCYTENASTPRVAIDNTTWVQFDVKNTTSMISSIYISTVKLILTEEQN